MGTEKPGLATTAPATEYRLAIDALDREIVSLAARMNASEYRLLVMIREFDERGGWLKWGLSNCPEWLHFRCDMSLSTGREKVRVAHALKGLSKVSGAFETGRLSYSKVRALTRVATAGNEEGLVAFALSTTAARVEERCRQMRNVEPESIDDANRAHRRRGLSVWRDDANGTLKLTVELPIESGELIEQALDKAVENASAQGPEFVGTSWHAQRADALVEIARAYLSGGRAESACAADHYQVVIHVDRSALTEGTGRSDLPIESVRRLTCDGSVIPMIDGPDGEPLNVGRKRRTVSTAIRRALWARDKGCAYPGCTHTLFVDAHHCVHWANGGETRLDEMLLLCTTHHRLVHEGGYTLRKDRRGQWYFRRPDGRAVPACGYSADDVADELIGGDAGGAFDVGAGMDVGVDDGINGDCVDGRDTAWHASADASVHHRGASDVREPRGIYLLRVPVAAQPLADPGARAGAGRRLVLSQRFIRRPAGYSAQRISTWSMPASTNSADVRR
jgi:hypothetical protein